MTLFLIWLAEALALDHASSEALATIEQALEVNPLERAWSGDALRIRGELRLNYGQTNGAQADFRDAISSAKKIGAKALELRAAMGLARMLKARGDIIEARDLLAPLYSSFAEGFDTAELRDARSLLDELSKISSVRAS